MPNIDRRHALRILAAIGTTAALLPPEARASDAGWDAEAAPSAIEIVISKVTQQMAVYVDGELRHVFVVSTGRAGHATPTGSFPVLWTTRMAYAPKYDNAPMPHSIFFTRAGHAIHATGHLKALGRPASHGCVRLTPEAAETLYALVQRAGRRKATIHVM
jgi:lipoprotein-anchoring transpeptidase ErfK/SrfK